MDRSQESYWIDMMSHIDGLFEQIVAARMDLIGLMASRERDVAADAVAMLGLSGLVSSPSNARSRSMQLTGITDQLVDAGDQRFIEGMAHLTEELSRRVRSLPESEHRSLLLEVVSQAPLSISARFGSFTASWDYVVALEQVLPRENEIDDLVVKWQVELFDKFIQFIRDVVRTSVLHAGRSSLLNAVSACFRSAELGMEPLVPERVAESERVDELFARAVLQFMLTGPRATLKYAELLSKSLGFKLYQPVGLPVADGLLQDVGDWLASQNLAYVSGGLLGERHDPHECHGGDMLAIADDLCAVGHSFAVRLLAAVAVRSTPSGISLALQRSSAGRARFRTLQLLRERRFSLARSVAESSLLVEPPGKGGGTMLKLNALYARKMLEGADFPVERVRSLDVGAEPRYLLIKCVLVDECSERNLKELLERALAEGDLTTAELEMWPALEAVRELHWWPTWLQAHT